MPAFGENQKCGGSSGAEPGPTCPVGEEQGHQDASCWAWGCQRKAVAEWLAVFGQGLLLAASFLAA